MNSDKIFNGIVIFISVLVVFIVAYPLLFVLSASFSNAESVMAGKVWLLPVDASVEGYKMVFRDQNILTGYRNSLMYAGLGTAVNIILTSIMAYPLSRRDLWGRKWLMMFITFSMLFSGGIIPTYLVVKNLRLTNTIWAMIVPTAIATYNLIVMRNYFESGIPFELQEAAKIDGCNDFRLFISVILPLSKPILAVISLYYAVGHWNAFFNALIYLRDSKLFPLQLILRDILLRNQADNMIGSDFGMREKAMMSETLKYAVIVVSSLPVMAAYPFVQKYFVRGIMSGAVKG